MRFNLKQLLALVVVVGVTAAALTVNFEMLASKSELVFLMCVFVLTITGYGIWTSVGETRAFRIGFVAWGGLYLFFHVIVPLPDHLRVNELLRAFLKKVVREVYFYDAFYPTVERFAQCVLALVVGLIGGWVTVYFYRQRQRMLSSSKAHNA